MAMKLVLGVFLLFLANCSFSKPSDSHLKKDNPKCKELFEFVDSTIIESFLKIPSVIIEAGTQLECPCIEAISCKGNSYCIANKCPSNDKPTSVFDLNEAALLDAL